MDIGNCCICLGGFGVAQMGVLPCLHTFHHSCIQRALGQNAQCPLCRRHATDTQIVRSKYEGSCREAGDLPRKAMRAALAFYDRTVRHRFADGSSGGEAQREELKLCLNSLVSTLESADAEREAKWERLKQFLRVCGTAAIFAVLAFLFTLYWPLFSSLAVGVVRTVWTLISSLRDLLVAHWPDLLFGGLLLSTFVDMESSDSQQQQAETPNIVEEPQNMAEYDR